ncbi:MAG: hypothetical protein AAFY60_00530, partial [Myxococcota bacterium]
ADRPIDNAETCKPLRIDGEVTDLVEELGGLSVGHLGNVVDQVRDFAIYPQGLASLSIVDGAISERKVYVALREPQPELIQHLPFADSVIHTNLMVTSTRGIVPQVDVDGQVDPCHFNPIAGQIIDRYAQLDIGVDTVAYQDADNYVLYVPA